jgi:hypothetical protein
MIDDDFKKFAQEWQNSCDCSANSKNLTNKNLSLIFEILREYQLEHVLSALNIHSRQSKFMPTPADIVEIINQWTSAKHIGPEEAWAVVIKSFDDSATVFWTQEMQDARKAAWPVWIDGDTVAARMVFKETYSRIIQTAGKPKWVISQGYYGRCQEEKEKQLEILKALQEAKQLGRLPRDYQPDLKLLPDPNPSADVSFFKLCEMAGKKNDKTHWAKIRENLGRIDPLHDDVEKRENTRRLFENHRANELLKIEEKMKSEEGES